MKKRYFLICLLAIFISSGFVGTSKKATGPADGTMLSTWMGLHLKLVRGTKGLSQGALFRHFTYASLAFYESIVNSEKAYASVGSRLQELGPLPVFTKDQKPCWSASGNAAMATMLRTFYTSDPAHTRRIDSLENHYAASFLKEGFTQESISASSAYGKSIANAVLEWAKTDGFATKYPPYEVPKGNGLWEPTPPGFSAPLAPYAHQNRTCVKGSTENTLPPKPSEFSTDANSPFYAMVNEVYQTSQNLTAEQRATALFWDDFPDGRYFGAAGHWASILRQVVETKKLSLMDGAAAYAAMNLCMMDAFVACWKGKYTYNLLRPVTYVQKHMGHPEWNPLIVTPSHPEYPAAHASLSMAAAVGLTHVLGNNVAFTDHSYDDMGFAARSFKNFEAAGREAGISRLYGGIHYRLSIEAGYSLGSRTAGNVLAGLNLKQGKKMSPSN